MTTFTSDDRQEAYKQKVEEAPYHPGYEDAVIPPKPAYKGMDPSKMLWKPKRLSEEVINKIINDHVQNGIVPLIEFARSIEERHGIK